MEKTLLRLTLSACVVIGGIALNSYSGGGFTSDLTGSPLSSSTCQNSCHNTYSLNSGTGSVSMSVPSSYYPGDTHSVSLTVTQSSPTPARYGFMAGALRDNNGNGGTFLAGTGSAATTISSRSYIRHNSVYNSSGTWSFDWVAPSYADTIIFYFVGNAANGNSGNSGDYIYTSSTTIYPIELITADLDSTAVSCEGDCDGSLTLSNISGGEGGPYTYAWSNNSTSASITGLCAGTYTVTIEDVNGNAEVIEASVGSPDALDATFTTINSTCASGDGEINVDAIGGTSPYTFVWNTGDTTNTILNALVGTYIVTITDSNGCTLIDTTEVQSTGSGLFANIQSEDENCGQGNGVILVNMTTGTAPYDYSWSNGSTFSTLVGLSAGTYTVTVTDSLGCTETFTETLEETIAEINVAGAIVTDAACYGEESGMITIQASQGIEPWFFDWSNGESGGTISTLSAGSYTVTMTDSAGCTDIETFTIEEPDSISVIATSDSSNIGFCDGSISLDVSGGTAPYDYTWSHDAGLNMPAAEALCVDTYAITVTDANGCEKFLTVIIGGLTGLESSDPTKISVFPNPANDHLVIRSPQELLELVEVMDLSGRIIRSWEEVNGSLDISDLATGRYSLRLHGTGGIMVRPLLIVR